MKKFFETLYTFLGVKHITITAYHSRTNGKAAQYNKTIVARWHHYAAERLRDWDIFVQPLLFAYKSPITPSYENDHVSLVHSWQAPGPGGLVSPTAWPTEGSAETPLKVVRFRLFSRIAKMRKTPTIELKQLTSGA